MSKKTPFELNITEEPVTLQEKQRLFINQISDKRSTKKGVLSLFAVTLAVLGVFYFSNRITRQTPVPSKSKAADALAVPWQYPRPVKVLIMRYFNPASSPDYKNPAVAQMMTDNMQANLYEASRFHNVPSAPSAIKIQVVGQYDFGSAPNINNDWEATYDHMLNTTLPNETQTACDIVNAQKVDEVWFLGDPTVPGFINGPEFAISSKFIRQESTTQFSTVVPKNRFCGGDHSLMMFFMDLSRPVSTVHAFSHYMESLIATVQTTDLFINKFMGMQYLSGSQGNGVAIPGIDPTSACGSVHVPPNVPPVSNTNPAQFIYQRENFSYPNTVSSGCQNWRPDGSGAKINLDSNVWINNQTNLNGDAEFKYHMWWLQRLPNINNGLSYANLPLPNWWDFVSDTDNTIAWYLNSPYFMNPLLYTSLTANTTSYCSKQSGTSSSCTYSPSGSTLGAYTESDVLAATTYGDMALVTVSYQPKTYTDAVVSSVKFCGTAMTRIGTGPSNGGGIKNEMWYLLSPKTGSCSVVVTFTRDAGERVISSTIFNNIDQINPVGSITKNGFSGPYSSSPTNLTATLAGPKDSLMLCGYDYYSEQTSPPSANFSVANSGTLQLWKYEERHFSDTSFVNIWAGLGGGIQRKSAGESSTLSWSLVKTQPYSYTCANFNVKQFPVITPVTPAPIPTAAPTVAPIPTPVPTVTPSPTSPAITYYLVPKNQITASATSQHTGYEAAKSIDENTSTFWHSEWSPLAALPQHVLLTLPNIYKVGKIGYLPRQDGGTNGNITGYKILVSTDGVTSTVAAQGTWANDQSLKSVTFNPINAKYVAIVATSGSGGYASASELAVWYTSAQLATPAPTPTATPSNSSYYQIAPSQLYAVGSSQHVGFESTRVTDNNTGTFWNSEWNPYDPAPQSIRISLGGLFPISKIIYTPRQDGSPVGNITSYRISVSNNGTIYSPVASGTWADNQTPKTATFFPTFANYVKLEAVKGNAGYASASEVTVWLTPLTISYSSIATATSQHVGFEAALATDTSPTTFWHSEWTPYAALPQSLTLNLGKQFTVKGLVYMPRQDGAISGTITAYKVYSSLDGVNYSLVHTGSWPNDTVYKSVLFTPVNAKYIRVQVDAGNGGYASAALLSIIY